LGASLREKLRVGLSLILLAATQRISQHQLYFWRLWGIRSIPCAGVTVKKWVMNMKGFFIYF
jgi:hypothetical protein